MRYYLDANVFLYALLYNDDRAKGARRLLRNIASGWDAGVSSCLAVDEVVWRLWRETGERAKAVAEGRRLLQLPGLSLADVDAFEIHRALAFMEKYRQLKLRDAIHLAACVAAGVRLLVSDDPDFDGVAEVRRVPLERAGR